MSEYIVAIPRMKHSLKGGEIVGDRWALETVTYGEEFRFGGNHPKWCYAILEAAAKADQPLLFEYSHSIKNKIYYGVPRNVKNAAEWISVSQEAYSSKMNSFNSMVAEKKAKKASEIVQKLSSRFDQIEIDMQALNDLLYFNKSTGTVGIDIFRIAQKHPERVFARFLTKDGRLAEITYGIALATHWYGDLDLPKAIEEAERLAK